MATEAYKACSACGQHKPISEFHKNARSSDGLRSSCKPCTSAINRKSVLRHHEKRKAEKRAYHNLRKDSPEYKRYVKLQIEKSREAKREYDRKRHVENRDAIIQRVKDWAAKNPEKRRAVVKNYDSKRRAWKDSGLSSTELRLWLSEQRKVCYWCGKKCQTNFHVDHYKPLSKGGEHSLSNLVISCPPCNLRKNAKDPLDFAQEVGRLF